MIAGIHTLKALKDNFIFVLQSAQTNDVVVIDPGEAKPVCDYLARENKNLKAILCTHHHPDHIGGVRDLHRLFNCEVWASVYDQQRISPVTQSLSDGQEFSIFAESVQVLHVPGHTSGQIAFFIPRLRALFSGDTLFSLGCGRLFEGTPEEMFYSLQKLAKLPLETQIYFAHEYTLKNLSFVRQRGLYPNSHLLDEFAANCDQKLEETGQTVPTLLSTELQLNPFLRAQTVEEFAELRKLRDVF